MVQTYILRNDSEIYFFMALTEDLLNNNTLPFIQYLLNNKTPLTFQTHKYILQQ